MSFAFAIDSGSDIKWTGWLLLPLQLWDNGIFWWCAISLLDGRYSSFTDCCRLYLIFSQQGWGAHSKRCRGFAKPGEHLLHACTLISSTLPSPFCLDWSKEQLNPVSFQHSASPWIFPGWHIQGSVMLRSLNLAFHMSSWSQQANLNRTAHKTEGKLAESFASLPFPEHSRASESARMTRWHTKVGSNVEARDDKGRTDLASCNCKCSCWGGPAELQVAGRPLQSTNLSSSNLCRLANSPSNLVAMVSRFGSDSFRENQLGKLLTASGFNGADRICSGRIERGKLWSQQFLFAQQTRVFLFPIVFFLCFFSLFRIAILCMVRNHTSSWRRSSTFCWAKFA